MQPGLGRRVRPCPDGLHEDSGVIPKEEEMPIDMYKQAMHRYQDNVGRGLNYQNMHTDLLFQHCKLAGQMDTPLRIHIYQVGMNCGGRCKEELAVTPR